MHILHPFYFDQNRLCPYLHHPRRRQWFILQPVEAANPCCFQQAEKKCYAILAYISQFAQYSEEIKGAPTSGNFVGCSADFCCLVLIKEVLCTQMEKCCFFYTSKIHIVKVVIKLCFIHFCTNRSILGIIYRHKIGNQIWTTNFSKNYIAPQD